MKNQFVTYLIVIFIIAALFGLLTFLLIRRLKVRNYYNTKGPVTSGNVSVFFDSSRNVVIIPYNKDRQGVGKAVGSPVSLKKPYSAKQLGEAVKYSMMISKSKQPCSNNVLMYELGYRTWKDFSNGKKNISVYYKEGKGMIFNSTIRLADGSYKFNYRKENQALMGNASDKDLGNMLLSVLLECK